MKNKKVIIGSNVRGNELILAANKRGISSALAEGPRKAAVIVGLTAGVQFQCQPVFFLFCV